MIKNLLYIFICIFLINCSPNNENNTKVLNIADVNKKLVDETTMRTLKFSHQ